MTKNQMQSSLYGKGTLNPFTGNFDTESGESVSTDWLGTVVVSKNGNGYIVRYGNGPAISIPKETAEEIRAEQQKQKNRRIRKPLIIR